MTEIEVKALVPTARLDRLIGSGDPTSSVVGLNPKPRSRAAVSRARGTIMQNSKRTADELILGFKLASGDFSSELRMLLPKTKKEVDRAVERWLDFMATGLRLSAERMDAAFPVEGTTA